MIPSDGSSSSSSFGRAISACSDREHLLLAAGHRPGLLALALLEPGEKVVDAIEVLSDLGAAPPVRAEVQVLPYGHPREARRPLGASAIPRMGIFGCVKTRVMSSLANVIVPELAGVSLEMERRGEGLALLCSTRSA